MGRAPFMWHELQFRLKYRSACCGVPIYVADKPVMVDGSRGNSPPDWIQIYTRCMGCDSPCATTNYTMYRIKEPDEWTNMLKIMEI